MKNLFNTSHRSNGVDWALLIARIGIAVLMLTHGIPKMIMLSSEEIQFPEIFGLSAVLSLSLAVFAEVFCSFFILIGLGTRAASIPLILTMMVALFSIHITDPFARQEPAIHYLLVYIVLLITGSGKYSIDYMLQSKSMKSITSRLTIPEKTGRYTT